MRCVAAQVTESGDATSLALCTAPLCSYLSADDSALTKAPWPVGSAQTGGAVAQLAVSVLVCGPKQCVLNVPAFPPLYTCRPRPAGPLFEPALRAHAA